MEKRTIKLSGRMISTEEVAAQSLRREVTSFVTRYTDRVAIYIARELARSIDNPVVALYGCYLHGVTGTAESPIDDLVNSMYDAGDVEDREHWNEVAKQIIAITL